MKIIMTCQQMATFRNHYHAGCNCIGGKESASLKFEV